MVRREPEGIRRYCHLGTGNYHSGNARLYTDYSLLTSDEALCDDVHRLFRLLTGMGKALKMKRMLYAPFTLKKGLLDLIAREAAHAAAGKATLVEMGGNGPLVVLEDADLDRAAEGALTACFLCTGQSCTAGERLLVLPVLFHLLWHGRLAADLAGGPLGPATLVRAGGPG